MNEELQMILDDAKDQMQKAIVHLENELAKIRAGRANPMMLENIMVDYYGNRTPLRHTANINSQDSRTLIIQPWEGGMLEAIDKALQAANLGITPQNDGKIIRLSIPPLTEERRKEMVKKVKGEAENCKVSIRTIRKETNEAIKGLLKEGLPEDEVKEGETKSQALTDEFIVHADKHAEKKEHDIMTV
ncbi:MAG TPA: ribosome recycling factor [Bacteroidia bacterium]|jgi:ribosome recycling factor|nr:ribosome recycling factor [Bacteroidia bacterium]